MEQVEEVVKAPASSPDWHHYALNFELDKLSFKEFWGVLWSIVTRKPKIRTTISVSGGIPGGNHHEDFEWSFKYLFLSRKKNSVDFYGLGNAPHVMITGSRIFQVYLDGNVIYEAPADVNISSFTFQTLGV